MARYFPSTSEVIASILATPVVPLEDETLDPNCEAYEHQADVDQAALANASTSSLDQVAQQPIVTTPIAQTSPTQLAQQWKPFSLLAFLDRQYGMPAIGFTNLVANGFKSNATVASRSAVTIQAPLRSDRDRRGPGRCAEEIDPMNSQFPNDNK